MKTIKEPTEVKARKDHTCDFCGFVINAGEVYLNATYKYDDIYRWKSHKKCSEFVSQAKPKHQEMVTMDGFYRLLDERLKELQLYRSDRIRSTKILILWNHIDI